MIPKDQLFLFLEVDLTNEERAGTAIPPTIGEPPILEPNTIHQLFDV